MLVDDAPEELGELVELHAAAKNALSRMPTHRKIAVRVISFVPWELHIAVSSRETRRDIRGQQRVYALRRVAKLEQWGCSSRRENPLRSPALLEIRGVRRSLREFPRVGATAIGGVGLSCVLTLARLSRLCGLESRRWKRLGKFAVHVMREPSLST